MHRFFWILLLASLINLVYAQEVEPKVVPEKGGIPESLQPWKDWVLSDEQKQSRQTPAQFNDFKKKLPLWPAKLSIKAGRSEGNFSVSVKVFKETWLSLPGSDQNWPQDVQANRKPAVVVERNSRPTIKLQPGQYRVSGRLPWKQMPQRLKIPPQIGVLELQVNGDLVKTPNWDGNGDLWLNRNRVEVATEKEFLEAKVYRLLEDGIPIKLSTQIDLSVAGKSREEDLGYALPEGWQVASVSSELPCAIDDSGRLRVQVRGGKWSIQVNAFRNDSIEVITYSDERKPVADQEIVGFKANPDFRLVELRDIVAVDVSQTTFPEKWRKFPVHRWQTDQPFRLEEKMRGMGFQKASGLSVKREFWLDEAGRMMTFRDRITGQSRQDWRLDISPGQTLGAARMDGEGQLITENPTDGLSGIELRSRRVEIEAVGRIENSRNFPASGWQADVEKCDATLHLPPGWRVLALFGAEWEQGDWLTSWTLLDLFLLLVFTMAIGKLWGIIPAIVALIGFGLTFHEPNAPRLLWFLPLIPVAILKLKIPAKIRTLVTIAKYITLAILMVVLVPFIGKQLQGVLYPQLETGGGLNRTPSSRGYYSSGSWAPSSGKDQILSRKKVYKENLKQDVQARIQTGPAVPVWSWRNIHFGWRGPVTQAEQVKIVLIPPSIQRMITAVRVLMLILLISLLFNARQFLPKLLGIKSKSVVSAIILLGLFGFVTTQGAAQEFPPKPLLDELRQRLLKNTDADAFPKAAEIPSVEVTIKQSNLEFTAEIHAAARVAVPLPGRLPEWSPLSVTVDGEATQAVARHNNYLWVALEPGIHTVSVEGKLSGATDWDWTFLLKPRRLTVDAPDWTVTGVKSNLTPEDQVFFSKKSPASTSEAVYDRKDFVPAIMVERELEIGLLWQVRSTLSRLNEGGKAVAFSIPLLPGERVLDSNYIVEDGKLQVRLGSGQKSVSWVSELPQTKQLTLISEKDNPWVERWKLIASPVWNVRFEGLNPVYEPNNQELKPVWTPWPSEQTTLTFSKPKAIHGATMTVRNVDHETTVGTRQRISRLKLNLQASLGQDLVLDLGDKAEVTALRIGDASQTNSNSGKLQPVRRDGSKVIIPVRPGEQLISLEWKTPRKIAFRETVDLLALPVESSNINTKLSLPSDRWVIWTFGPMVGPVVRLWSILLLTLVGAFILGRIKTSPLKGYEWGLFVLGLSQVHPIAMLFVVFWFFLITWRGRDEICDAAPRYFNLVQLAILALALPVGVIVLYALHRGLLGRPEMMVLGNFSSPTNLNWFAQRTDAILPQAGVLSLSIWFYRIFMLVWALWLAMSSLKWARWAWGNFSRKGFWKHKPKIESPKTPPAIM